MRLPFLNRTQAKTHLAVEDKLTEDPERQRARHRLIGAIFLVLIAVVGLPMIFDANPKQQHNDIAIQIIQPGSKDKSEQKPDAATTKSDAKPDVKADVKPEAKADGKTEKVPPVAKTLDKGEEVLAILENRTGNKDAAKETSKEPAKEAIREASKAEGQFYVQIGAFSSEERVKNWQAKLTEQKVSTYVEIRNNKEGVKLHLLRSGPYPDRAAAEAAEKKIRYVGLSPKIVAKKPE